MLPKIDVPIYETTLISNGMKIKFRPFLVKEQKLFLMASQSDDSKDMIDAIKQVIRNCVLTEIDVDSLPTFDLENLFIQLRARSVNEIVNLSYNCNNKVTNDKNEEKACGNLVSFDINLLELQAERSPNHTNKIAITDKLGIVMKYPTFNMMEKVDVENNDLSQILEIIVSCIDYIYDEDNLYYAKDATKEELTEFVESMKQTDLEKIQEFFTSLPKLKKDIHFHCDKCGYEENITVEGIQNFFV
jgi:hypothetical protein